MNRTMHRIMRPYSVHVHFKSDLTQSTFPRKATPESSHDCLVHSLRCIKIPLVRHGHVFLAAHPELFPLPSPTPSPPSITKTRRIHAETKHQFWSRLRERYQLSVFP